MRWRDGEMERWKMQMEMQMQITKHVAIPDILTTSTHFPGSSCLTPFPFVLWLVVRLGGGLGGYWGRYGGRLGSVRPSWGRGWGGGEAFSNNRLSEYAIRKVHDSPPRDTDREYDGVWTVRYLEYTHRAHVLFPLCAPCLFFPPFFGSSFYLSSLASIWDALFE